VQVPEPYTSDIGIARLVKRASAGFYGRLKGWLLVDKPSGAIRENWDEVAAALPELAAEKGCTQDPKSHSRDVLGHSLEAVDRTPRDEVTRLAALLHDVGKPVTRVEDDKGVPHFPDHAKAGARVADRMLERIGAPEDVRRKVQALVGEHFITYKPWWPKERVLSLARHVDPSRLNQLAKADIEAHRKTCPWLLEDREQLEGFMDRLQRLRLERKTAEFAPGLPEKGRVTPLPSVLKPREFDFAVQRHDALRAKTHLDVRIADPETGIAHSWATKKLPRPGEGTYAPQQPDHTLPYLGFEGKIESGYGAGDVSLVRREKTEVVSSSPKEMRFNLYGGRVPEQFSLVRQGGEGNRMWVLRNLTPARSTARWGKLVPSDKPRLPTIPFERLDAAIPGELWQPKVDGAHGVLVLEGGKPARLFSYRTAKNETGLIEHTHKMPRFWANVAPEGLKPTVLRVEITGKDRQGRPIPVSELGGILNASVPASREKQKAMGARLNLYGLGVERADGRLARHMPHEEQMGLIRQLSRDIPLLRPMPTARTEEQKRRLQAEVRGGEHSLTREGVVVIRPGEEDGGVYKSPRTETHDVHIRRILPGLREGEAGGFEYSWAENGPVAGVTGTGFTRGQRRDMLANPDNWVGRVAKVRAKERFPSGALRTPAFREFHIEKGTQQLR